MKILSIDTASNICAVAVLENNKLIEEKILNDTKTHSEKIMPTIIDVLNKTNLKLEDFDLIVCDKGPGSFTGIRIGVATVLAFKDALKIKTIGISSLEALAYNVKTDGIICSLIDARNSNVYYGIFKLENNNYSLLEKMDVNNINDVLNLLEKYNEPIFFVGDGSTVYKELISNKFIHSTFCSNNELSAYSLGLAGFKSFNEKSVATDDIMPLYLRKSQAERALEEKNRSTQTCI